MSMTKEQKAIEILTKKVDSWKCKRPRNPIILKRLIDEIDTENNAIETVLNMLKEKDKEIEHQIEKRNNQKAELAILNEKQKDMNKLINDVKSYKGQFKRQEKQIRELQKENEEKDKQIDELVKYIDSNNYVDNEECQFQWDFKIEKCAGNGDCKECIKQYFEKLAKEKGE